MSNIQTVSVNEAAAIRSDGEAPDTNTASTLSLLLGGEMIFSVDAEDLAEFKGKNSRLIEHGKILRTKRGDHGGRSGTFAWVEDEV